MDRKHIMLIGHPDGYYQFIDFLLSKGYKITWVRDKEADSKKIAPNLAEISLDILNEFDTAMDEILKLHKKDPIHAVATHHEFYCIAKSKIAEKLGLISPPADKFIRATNKYFMKQCFVKNGVSTARFTYFRLTENINTEIERIESEIPYPLVVKPCTCMGSMGVVKVQNRDELKKAIRVGRQIAFNIHSSSSTIESNQSLIVEEYIHGDEFTVDGFVINGQWVPMISCEKYPPLVGPTFQENVYFFSPKDGEAIPGDLAYAAKTVVDALDVGDGPYHIEIRRELKSGKCYVVEAAPRIAGVGSTFFNLMYYSTGYNIYDLYIKQCLGEKVDIPCFDYKCNTFEYDSFAKKGGAITQIKGLEEILKHPTLVHAETFKKIGDTIGSPGLNPETTAVFYFKTDCKAESVRIVDWIENIFEICTQNI